MDIILGILITAFVVGSFLLGYAVRGIKDSKEN